MSLQPKVCLTDFSPFSYCLAIEFRHAIFCSGVYNVSYLPYEKNDRDIDIVHFYLYYTLSYVTVHTKRWHKSAKILFSITLDFAFIGSSASSLQIWS